MDITIHPGGLTGTVRAIPSKSQAHRLMICAAFSDGPTYLECPQTNADIEATARCLNALGADIQRTADGYQVTPVKRVPATAVLNCAESGSTLRFLLPIACALGVEATFQMEGRLPCRPLSPLWEELERMGCSLSRPTETTILISGKLQSGEFSLSGKVSSQFITGLLFATALLDGKSLITITDSLESKSYVEMTQLALRTFGVDTDSYCVKGSFPFRSPGKLTVEGDWSNGAFWLAAKALGNCLTVTNLSPNSPQGDRASAQILADLEHNVTVSAADIPDLVPILAVVAGATKGAVFTDIARLRLKESDRVASVCNMLNALGATAFADENTLTVKPGKYHSCTIDAVNDHRIAMSAAIAATVADGPVTVLGAECVSKSYPAFWQVYKELGGKYEQHLR
ncbi:MAG: 3-phosphoshikimate 1-carboxyvinyltransferase [Oscillospiraceae bacterium]|nr:3-phosphoshikimate 1-carboxyvinyltransferase [Oscillospiraceae bacterium]